MDTNDNIRNELPDDVIVLGVASVETKGGPADVEGTGGEAGYGISDE